MDLLGAGMLIGSTASDHIARTFLSAAGTLSMAPAALTAETAAEVSRLEYHATIAAGQNADRVFLAPPSPIPVHARRLETIDEPSGRVDQLRFHSPYEPLHPGLRNRFKPTANNATAQAYYWRHNDEPRKTLMVVHGMSASAVAFNSLLFDFKGFFAAGWDIVLCTLPYHGARASGRSLFNGRELFTSGFSAFNEAMLQAVCDLRVVLDYLQRQGSPRVGITGLSLGGYAAAALAAVDDRLDFAIPNSAVADLPALMHSWPATRAGVGILEKFKGLPWDLVSRSMALHGPLNYPSKLPVDRLLVIAGERDQVAPPKQSLMLWEHWQRPALQWFPSGHILHLQRHDYLQRMRELMEVPRDREPEVPAAPAAQPTPLQNM